MNKKGFTLVELLAAIVVLALLSLITIPAVTNSIKTSKNDLYDTQLRSFKDSAKGWGAENAFSNLPDRGACLLIPLQTLIDEGLVEPNVKNPITGDAFTSSVSDDTVIGTFIKIKNEGTTNNKFVYEAWDCTTTCHSPDSEETSYNDITDSCIIYGND